MSEVVLLYERVNTLRLARAVISSFLKDLKRTVKASKNNNTRKAEEARTMVNLFFSPNGICETWCALAEIDEVALRNRANEILKGEI